MSPLRSGNLSGVSGGAFVLLLFLLVALPPRAPSPAPPRAGETAIAIAAEEEEEAEKEEEEEEEEEEGRVLCLSKKSRVAPREKEAMDGLWPRKRSSSLW